MVAVAAMTDVVLDLDELPYLVGRAWTVGDGLRAEDILPADSIRRDFAEPARVFPRLQPAVILAAGDFIVAGLEFGSGAATRTTTRALRMLGAGAVIARSFGEEFVRCALHVGLPPLQIEEAGAIKSGDRLRV